MTDEDYRDEADSVMDPRENPANSDHLPVSGEAGVGPGSYHDPLTTDTNDDPDTAIDSGISEDIASGIPSDNTDDADINTPDDQPRMPESTTDNMQQIGEKRENPGPDPDQLGGDPTAGGAGSVGLS